MKINPFAYHLWQRFWAIASPYWRGDERLRAWGLLALLVVLLLGQTRFAVMLNEQTGEFTSALAARDETRFWDSIQFCVVLLLMAVAVIYAGTRGYLDGIATADVGRYEAELLARLHSKHQDILDTIRTSKELKADTEAKLKEALEAFTKSFA